jgi:hypothetical protein
MAVNFYSLQISSVFDMVYCMVTTYKLNTRELENTILDSIKTSYPDQVIEIQVRGQDETEYLLSTPANRERMEKILIESENGELIKFESLEQAVQAAKQC